MANELDGIFTRSRHQRYAAARFHPLPGHVEVASSPGRVLGTPWIIMGMVSLVSSQPLVEPSQLPV